MLEGHCNNTGLLGQEKEMRKNWLYHLKPSSLTFRRNSSMSELTEQFVHEMKSLDVDVHTWVRGREVKSQHWHCDSVWYSHPDEVKFLKTTWHRGAEDIGVTRWKDDVHFLPCAFLQSRAEGDCCACRAGALHIDRQQEWWSCHCSGRLNTFLSLKKGNEERIYVLVFFFSSLLFSPPSPQ